MRGKNKKSMYRRIIIKLTGESLAGRAGQIDLDAIDVIAREVVAVHALGVQVGIIVGGGNIVRGAELSRGGRIERVDADYMGMLATAINALALAALLREHGLETRVLSAIEMKAITEPYIRGRAIKHLEHGRVVIFSGGTGNPHFSTDTAAVLRASEVQADAIIKATKVEGIYTDDPATHKNAELIRDISYEDAFRKRLKFMDAAAIGFAMENYPKPIHVICLFKKGNLSRVVQGDKVGSKIYS